MPGNKPGQNADRGPQSDQNGEVYGQQLRSPQHPGSHQYLADIMGDRSGHGDADDPPVRVSPDQQEENQRGQPCQTDQPDTEEHLASGSGIAGKKERIAEKRRYADNDGAEL